MKLAMARVVSVPSSIRRRAKFRLQILAAFRFYGMKKDHSLAPVQFTHHRLKRRVAGIFSLVAGHHAHAVGLERVLAVFNFAKSCRQRRAEERWRTCRSGRDDPP